MPKKIPEDLYTHIEAEIARHPEGVGIDVVQSQLAERVSRRTLQRRLLELVEQQRLVAIGQGKARLYQLAPSSEVESTKPAISETAPQVPLPEVYVPTLPDSADILDYFRRPVPQRKPVGYNRAFIETYQPNASYYLSQAVRDYLLRIGRSPQQHRPAGTYARDLLGRLLIDLSWASSRLEGNTYTRLDTQNLIERGEAAQGKDRREAQMILNHKAAIELLVEQAEDIGFNTFTFFNLHALLSENLLVDPSESGRLRNRIVDITGTVFHPLGIPQQLEHYFRLILDKAAAIEDPFEQAFFVMVHIPYLQPFVDVNKRVSRLGANIPLIRHNLCPLSFIDVPEQAYVKGTLGVYELNRVELLRDVFVWAYERSCQRYQVIRETVAEPDPLRLRYREALIVVVGELVRAQECVTPTTVRAIVENLVPQQDIERVTAMALEDFNHLHEGNISRYRLRLSEFRAWQRMHAATRNDAAN